jgi:transposase InsO family protein
VNHLSCDFAIEMLCRLVDLPRSSYYYRATVCDEATLQAHIRQVSGQFPTYGVRRVTAQVRREFQVQVNHKRVARVMRGMGINRKKRRKKRKTTQSQHEFPRYPNLLKDLAIQRPDQVWVCDITYIHLAQGDVYLAVIMDLFTRCIRGWHLSRSLAQALTLTALERALPTGCPEIHHSDQGVQYASPKDVEALKAHHVQISMAQVGEATQNAHAERLMRTIKEEEVNLSEYRDFYEARRRIGAFLDDVYQHKRIHSALGYLTPVEYEAQWRARTSNSNRTVQLKT